MRHASLFSGIGGFDLAAERVGFENVFHCEINPFCQRLLKYYWPHAESYTDITKTDFSVWRGRIDILTGGFPCQPYSVAGKRKGTEDNRHLWPEMLRAICEIQPAWIIGENVPGFINWSDGLVFEQVQADLEAEGYEVQPFVLPACAVNAPHIRERVWIIAYNHRYGQRRNNRSEKDRHEANENESEEIQRQWLWDERGGNGSKSDVADAPGFAYQESGNGRLSADTGRIAGHRRENKQQGYYPDGENAKRQKEADHTERLYKQGDGAHASSPGCGQQYAPFLTDGTGYGARFPLTDWSNWPTQSPICTGDDGLSSRLDGITFPAWRRESIRGAGNAVIPDIPQAFFEAIKTIHNSI